ncbi:MAG: NAD(P)H-hydrate dehydratase [Lachnospiraceae bacterium]|nr:NAD(P)H-hydrate dehydratase [Lachnospiraceae bacterium]
MEYLVTAKEMQQYDYNTIHTIGIPGMVLMERAALAAFSLLEDKFSALLDKSAFILVGTGNNGGDGLALARLLSEAGYDVTWQCVGNKEQASKQWKEQYTILEHYPAKEGRMDSDTEYTVLVDALFGVGLSRELTGEYAGAIDAFNRGRGYKLALDIPSGVHADNGAVLGCAARVDATITFGFCKRGLVLFPGAEYAGEVITANIGICKMSFLGVPPQMFCYHAEKNSLLPRRNPCGNKGTFGKVLIVAGSEQIAGAAGLAAKAAYRSGAGMVKVISAKVNRPIVQCMVPEALYGTITDLEEGLKWADVIAIGPGILTDKGACECLQTVLFKSRLPLVIDADALNILAQKKELQKELARQGREGRTILLTPHVKELSRLVTKEVELLKEALWEEAMELAKALQVIVVAKDARTFICKENSPICVNIYGNSGMATAGSGDVLTGVIAGLLAQNMEPFEAACVGVCLHARAGDRVAERIGEHACMAGDLIEML